MDANKRVKLLEIGYEIPPSCGTCAFSDIKPTSDYGECSMHTYTHQKHTDSHRQLSVHRYGGCPSYKPSDHFEATIGLWEQFVK